MPRDELADRPAEGPTGRSTDARLEAAPDAGRSGTSRSTFIWVAAGLVSLLALVAATLLSLRPGGVGFVDLEATRHAASAASAAWALLKTAPAPVYFGFMSVAILAPLPASLFYVAAGPLYGIGPALLWIAPALAINALLVHLIAGSLLRPRLEALVARRGRDVPRLATRADQALFIALVRITPGIPFFVQNWVLGLADLERAPFIAITVAIQMLYATGFVVLGESAAEGRIGPAVLAGGALLAVSVGARLLHGRLRARSRQADSQAVGSVEIETPERVHRA